MLNIIKMEQQQLITGLKAQGWSDRKIAKELGLNRRRVKRYRDSKCTIAQTGKVGITSLCLTHKSEIIEWYESGLSIERIHTDLKLKHDFKGSYHSVYRFVKGLDDSEPKRVHRMECEPGQEAQIDYGTLHLRIGENRRLKKIHILLITLSHLRILNASCVPERIFSKNVICSEISKITRILAYILTTFSSPSDPEPQFRPDRYRSELFSNFSRKNSKLGSILTICLAITYLL